MAEVEDLRTRLAEAEELLRAIRSGEVDAMVVSGPQGEQVFTLQGADHAYRVLIEGMAEGAVTLAPDGTILYCNHRFAGMLSSSLEKVIGASIFSFFATADKETLKMMLMQDVSKRELSLRTEEGTLLPVFISISAVQIGESQVARCMILTDLTEQKRSEEIVASEKLARLIVEQAAEAIVVCDETGRIIRTSKATTEICGFDPTLQYFENVFDIRFSSGEKNDELILPVSAVMQGSDLLNVEASFERKDKRRFYLQLNAGPLRNELGEIIGSVVTLADITELKRAEEELQSSQSRFKVLVQNLSSGVALVDEFGRFSIVNPAFLKMFGLPENPSDIKNVNDQNWGEWQVFDEDGALLHVDDHPVRKAAMTGKAVKNRLMGVKLPAGGDLRWMLISAEPILKPDGRINLLICTYYDVTEQKRAEHALQRSEQRWATTLSSIGDAVIAADIEGRLTFMNAVAEGLTGWTWKEASMKPVTEVFNIINEHTRRRVQDPVAKVIELGMIVGLANHTILLRKDGTEVPIDDSGAPIRDKDGKTTGVVLVFRDITERKRAEEELRYHANLVDNVSDAIISTDRELKIRSWNKAAERIYGWQADEVIGLKGSDVLQTTFPEGLSREAIAKDIFEKGSWEGELIQRTKDGRDITVHARSMALKDEAGNVIGGVSISSDITERKRAEEALKKQAALIDLTPDGILIFRLDWTITFWSQGAQSLYGWTRQEAIGQQTHTLLKTRFPQPLEQMAEQVQRTGCWSGELIHFTKDGRQVIVQSRWQATFDDQGNVIEVLESNEDITERKHAEIALQESEQRWATTLSSIGDAVIAADIDRQADLHEHRGREFDRLDLERGFHETGEGGVQHHQRAHPPAS